MRFRRRSGVGPSRAATAAMTAIAATAAVTLIAACSSSGSSGSSSSTPPATSTTTSSAPAAAAQTTIGVDLTYNDTAFWAAYINYETQYAAQLHITLLGPL